MKSTNTTIFGLLMGVCVLLVALGVITICLAKENNRLKKAQQTTDNREQELAVIVGRYVDANESNHAVLEENPVTRRQIKDGTAIRPAYVDSLATALKLAKNDITESTRIIATLEGKLKGTVSHDSIKGKVTHFNGPYLQASVAERDTVLNYKYNAQFDITKYDKKKWLLGKKHSYRDFSAKDPNMLIDGVRSFTVLPDVDRRRIGLGLHVGYYYDPLTNNIRPMIGAGLSYNLITF
ncbi:MAG TPA: hypothetical protein VGB63_13030 [Pedobacter sp.]|jgi:hypothetical protein